MLEDLLGFFNQPDTARDILTNRFQPTAQDIGNAALAGVAGNTYVSPQNAVNSRMGDMMRQMAMVQRMQGTMPSAIQEYEYYSKLPTEQQQVWREGRRATQFLDTGGAMLPVVPGGYGAPIPKTLPPEQTPSHKANVTSAVKKAEATTGAEISLPDAQAAAENTLSLIDKMVGNKKTGIAPHPGLGAAVGPISSKLPTLTNDPADFEALVEQVQAGAFLDSIKHMQGYGALSNEEGRKATAAATRMKLGMGEPGFIQAADEYRGIVTKGVERMRKMARGGLNSPQGGPVPIDSGKTIIKTQISPSTGKRKIIYSDGTEEIQ